MPRGGFRPGAGRKPKNRTGVVLGMNGERVPAASSPLPPAIAPEVKAALTEPPADLTAEQATAWRWLAPKAIEARTLTPNTEPAFRELCRLVAIVRQLDDRIATLGCGTQDSLPHLRERRGQAGQLATALKDFMLSSFGKPALVERPKAPNPFAAFGRTE